MTNKYQNYAKQRKQELLQQTTNFLFFNQKG